MKRTDDNVNCRQTEKERKKERKKAVKVVFKCSKCKYQYSSSF